MAILMLLIDTTTYDNSKLKKLVRILYNIYLTY